MKLKLKFDPDVIIGEIRPGLYGSFVEHIGRCVYGGIYDGTHKTRDAYGFRGDVKALVKELGVTTVRYPGGNFVSGYDWKDGVGPERRTRLDYAWQQAEPNTVGTAEFLRYAKEVGFEPMMCVNLGTATPKDAIELLEYCNSTVGYFADLRASHGFPEPFGVRYWCLGNEMDGDWQIGHCSPEEYAHKARETAKLFRAFDPTLHLTVCGSSNTEIASYPSWDRKVLERTYDLIDSISVHSYYYADENTVLADYMGSGKHFARNIETIAAVCDVVSADKRTDKQIKLSVDEWNVWRHYAGETGKDNWTVGPERLESKYTLADAVVFTSMLTELINHCDRIETACLAQLVNVIAPILTENGGRTLKQSTFYPFAAASSDCRGKALRAYIDAPMLHSDRYGDYPALSCAVTKNGKTGTVILVNTDCERSYRVTLPSGVKIKKVKELYNDDVDAVNTFDEPDKVTLKEISSGDELNVRPHSVQFVTFE